MLQLKDNISKFVVWVLHIWENFNFMWLHWFLLGPSYITMLTTSDWLLLWKRKLQLRWHFFFCTKKCNKRIIYIHQKVKRFSNSAIHLPFTYIWWFSSPRVFCHELIHDFILMKSLRGKTNSYHCRVGKFSSSSWTLATLNHLKKKKLEAWLK